MEAALQDDALDLIGMARPAILNPSVPTNTILNAAVEEKDAKAYARLSEPPWVLKKIGNVVIGAGAETQEQTPPYLRYRISTTHLRHEGCPIHIGSLTNTSLIELAYQPNQTLLCIRQLPPVKALHSHHVSAAASAPCSTCNFKLPIPLTEVTIVTIY
ncbi:NADPH dehydrogenase [Ilyonectria robusta]